jgi:two-component system KDP operon response regulator KdpE
MSRKEERMCAGTVLIVDNNVALVREIKVQLVHLGLEGLWASGGREAIQLFLNHTPDAVILRDTLPDFSGWETAELIRAISDAPLIFLSDHPERLSRNRALQLGDEYLTPPWRWDRLRARLVVLLKRSAGRNNTLSDPYDDGFLKVDISGRAITRAGERIELTHTEFKLLSCFVRHPNHALSHSDILQSVWGHTYFKAKSDVTLYVWHLRKKIEANPARPTYLRTIRGVGYLFAPRL